MKSLLYVVRPRDPLSR